jgi:hypothetical protein
MKIFSSTLRHRHHSDTTDPDHFLNSNSESDSMLTITVGGPPIGGEDDRENAWVGNIVAAVDLTEIRLRFTLALGRQVDLDNLVRPAIRALTKARLISGPTEIRSVTASKTVGSPEGLQIESGVSPIPGANEFEVSFDSLPRGSNTRVWMKSWAEKVRSHWLTGPINSPVFVTIELWTPNGLIDLMKPILDGLDLCWGAIREAGPPSVRMIISLIGSESNEESRLCH